MLAVALIFPVLQNAAGDIIQMQFGRFRRLGWFSLGNGFKNSAVLGNQRRARVFGLMDIDNAAACLLIKHFEQAAGKVAEQDIVCGIGNGLMEADVCFGLMLQISAFAGRLKLLPPEVNAFQIGVSPSFGGQRRHTAFNVTTEIEYVCFPIGMFAEQLLPAL